ncbi:MAG TPA: amino acid adenylation domain-containing protein, partial [Candidatus Sulfotelmatobacter sp.]|nr:amino acid adenylation domain-containing protein [Candidatus Sulfotelmatobacter sp.]
MKNPFAAPDLATLTVAEAAPSSDMRNAELLHELFEHQARTRPNATALVCAGEVLTYSQLEGQANQLARWLRHRGVQRGDCVGLLLPRSPQVYVALLGILKAGAAYVPLDPEYPAQRLGFILADCGAQVLVTTSALSAKAAAFEGTLLELDANTLELAQLPTQSLSANETGTKAGDLGYVIYTSGTTGNPKGVQIEHRSVCHLVRAEAQIFQVQPQDRVYQGFSIAFDASVEEVWLAFYAGATLVVGTQEMVHAGAGLSRLLTEAGVTVLSCVPTLLAMMDEDVPSLRLLILGGEACPPELVKRWWQPRRRLVNTYGPTEATVIATYAECHPERPVTIGRPLPDRFACIVNERLEPVADSSPGELCLGGMGLARGYLGRPELTREKFIYLNEPDGSCRRVYRTGDLVRWAANGEIEFLGRIDTQVKIRGFRVELSEIEAALTDCPEVRAAAVSLREDVPGVQQLVAYVVPRSPSALTPEGLRARLRTRLPVYMMPAHFEPL